MVMAAARSVEPPDFSLRMLVGKCVEHRQDWSCPNPCADQEQRRVARVKREGAAGRGDLELIPHTQPGVQVSTRGPVMLALDADPVIARVRRSAEGVIAQ